MTGPGLPVRGYRKPEFTHPSGVMSMIPNGIWGILGLSQGGPSHAERVLSVSSGGQPGGFARSHVGQGGLCWMCCGAQASCPCRAPEPLELMLPVVLLADARVAQGSIGTPVVSISACLSLFGDAILFDGSNRWVPGGGWATGIPDTKAVVLFLEFPTEAFIQSQWA